MLVLSRKRNEWIKINDNVSIVVVEIRGDKVRIGFDAPKDVSIQRKEIYDAIQRQKEIESQGWTPEKVEAFNNWKPPVTKIVRGIETTYCDVDDSDWDSSEGNK